MENAMLLNYTNDELKQGLRIYQGFKKEFGLTWEQRKMYQAIKTELRTRMHLDELMNTTKS